MKAVVKKPGSIDEYLSTFPPETKMMLGLLRKTIRETVPQAEEVISYNMPAAKWHGMLVYYAGYKNHIGFYPTGSGIKNFQKDLTGYKTSKGTVQFPLDKPLPLSLIKKMIRFRVKENKEKAERHAKK
jgi:uncharacterized protein YdhG (YjbR/CyaY superfamily)